MIYITVKERLKNIENKILAKSGEKKREKRLLSITTSTGNSNLTNKRKIKLC